MINYETQETQLLQSHQSYCESIEKAFAQFKSESSGQCSPSGFDIKNTLIGNFKYHFHFHKKITVRRNSTHVISLTSVNMEGLNKSFKLEFVKNKIRRLFMPKHLKKIVPRTYFFKTNVMTKSELEMTFIKFLVDNKITKFKIFNGKAEFKMSIAHPEPLIFIQNLENNMKEWTENI